ncbi:MAG: oligogalacturonate lyase family protein [Caldilineaceae bacterium]
MTKGTLYPAESQIQTDDCTSARIRQITNHPSIHHHPFFMIPAYDDAMRWLIFASARTGSPQLFAEVRATGELLQLTDRSDLDDWSIHPSHDGRYVYFTAGSGGWRVNLETQVEEQLVDFTALLAVTDAAITRDTGMVAAALGTTALSHNDRYWAVKFKAGDGTCLAVIDTTNGKSEIILRRDTVAHVQFCPDDDNLIFYAGPLTDRVWLINRDGSHNRRLYQRSPGEWITHETWIPGTRELAFVDWPKGVRCIQVDTGVERRVTSFNAWHPVCNRAGTRMVADTNFPDIGIQLFNPLDGIGEPKTLCYPAATSMGAHWAGPFPYDKGPIQVYAPQHTHPHPSFSPDGRLVVYASDRTGYAQLYEVMIP